MAIVFVGLLAAWIWSRAINGGAQTFDSALRALDTFVLAESELRRDVLRARSGLLRNYDPLVREENTLRATLEHIPDSGKLAERVSMQEALIEAFKSRNALLQNSLSYFERFSAQLVTRQGPLAERVSRLTDAMLKLTLDTSPDAVDDVDRKLAEVASFAAAAPDDPLIEGIIAHGRMLRDLLPETDDLVKELSLSTKPPDSELARIRALLVQQLASDPPRMPAIVPAPDSQIASIGNRSSGLRAMLEQQVQRESERARALALEPPDSEQANIRAQVLERQRLSDLHARRARYALIAPSLVLFALLVYLGLQLRSRALALRRRAAIEHLITRISTRFIRFRPHELEPLIVQALAELAQFIKADRAYCLIQANRNERYEWCRSGESFPTGWPESAMSLAREIGANDRGVTQVRNTRAKASPEIREILSAAGVTEWLCISGTSTGRLTGLLAFDRVHAHTTLPSDDLSLFRMALDAISNAIERQNLEGDRERLESNLQHARRMETIGALTSGIAHNFNNIVGAILGFTENAQLQLPMDSHANGSLSEIRRAGGRARDLVEQILAFGRRGATRRTCISVREWLDEATSMLEATLPPHVRLTVPATVAETTICGEPASLQQVILNICNNAAQAMDSPGVIRIEIETSRIDAGSATGPAEIAAGHYVVVSVTDSGRGMDETTLERAFEPFFTTRSEGNGLGLPMVRRIVSDHGGAVRIHSTPGAGTRVDIWLPRASPAELATLNDTPRATRRRGGETILVVESNRERLLRHEEILAALGFEPVGFTRGSDAEAAYLADPTRFDVALYCAHLQDGTTVLAEAARLADTAPHLPILLASSSPADFAAPTLVEAGIAEIVRQPLSSVELAGALARCLATRAPVLRSQPQLLPS